MNAERLARPVAAALAAAAALFLAGCETMADHGPRHRSAAVVEYLYGDAKDPRPDTRRPVLHVPLRVGVAFVPAGSGRADQPAGEPVLGDEEQRRLLEAVAARFRGLPFVASIEVIPSAYLRPRGGFANLDQVAAMLRVDEVVLVSYDLMQFSNGTPLSVTMWTLVGPYVFPTEGHSTHVLLDAAVFDVPSRRLLFRAPGVAEGKGMATIAGTDRTLRDEAVRALNVASTNMASNLQLELARFQERLKSEPGTAEVVKAPGYQGGSVGLRDAAAVAALGLVVLAFRRRG